MRIDTAFAPNGSRLVTTTDAANSAAWNREIESFIDNNPINKIVINDNGTVAEARWYDATLAGEIGGALGSSLGRLLGGNSLVGQVAAGTVISTIGKEIGNALTYGGVYTLDVAVKDAFGTLAGGSNVGALPSAAIGALSSLAIAELAEALGLDGFEGGVFTSVGSTITTKLVTNAFGVMTGATINGLPNGDPVTMFTGFDPLTIAGNIGGAVAGYFGSTLAAHVMVPQHAEGAIGQSVGSSVGGAVGAVLFAGIPVVGPIIGSFLGSFLGGVAGSFLGDLAGNDPEAHGRVGFAADHRFYADPTSFWGDHGGDGETFSHMAVYTANTVNALADFAGVQMNAAVVTTAHHVLPMTGLQLRYGQDTRDFWINDQTGSFLALVQNVDDQNDIAPLVNAGIMGLTDRVALTGGDPLVRLAWANSTANNPTAFALDLQLAKDYRTYLDDKAMIDAMMAAAPESAFTAGWVLTLLKARELGLDAAPASDDFRNGNDTLTGTDSADFLVGGLGHDIMNGGGGNDRLRGDAGNDVMRGGAGDDALVGGADVDTAVFSGLRAAYTLIDLGDGVVKVVGPDGTDTLVTMERLQFDDRVVTLPLYRDLSASLSFSGTTANYSVRNNGSTATGWFTSALYLSVDTTITAADTLLSSSEFGPLGYEATAYRSASLALPGNLTPGTYYLGARADIGGEVGESDELNNVSNVVAVMLGNDSANTLTGTNGNDTIFALGGNDVIQGGLGADIITGGAGADRFVVPASAVTTERIFTAHSTVDRILDYNRAAGDQVDLAALVGYWHSIDQPVPALARVVAAGTGASVQVDTDGNYNGQKWVTVARLEGVHAGDTVNAIIHSSLPAGSDLIVQNRTTGDFTGDGSADIFWRTDGGALATWDMNGNQIEFGSYFHIGSSNIGVPDPSWHVMGTADFDGDGKRDVLWVTDSDLLAVWLMNGTEIKSADYVRNNGGISGVPPGWSIVGATDIDGDSMADLIMRNSAGDLATWTMTGSAIKCGDYIWSGANPANAGPDWHLAGTDDFDGDGIKDLLWRTDAGHLAVWEMDGSHVKEADYLRVGSTLTGAPAPDWRIAGTGDFDGDGKSDILWKTDGGALAIWELDGNQIKLSDYIRMGSTQINVPAADWHIAEIGDYDGDRKSDILWQTDGGALAVWKMNGTQIATADYVRIGATQINKPGLDWHIVQQNYDLM